MPFIKIQNVFKVKLQKIVNVNLSPKIREFIACSQERRKNTRNSRKLKNITCIAK